MKIRRNYGTVAFALAGSLLFLANTTAAAPPDKKNPLVLEAYRSFFIGGQRVPEGCQERCRLDGHAYVEAFIPQPADGAEKKAPIIMMHTTISATIFLEAANGTEGAWAPFVRAGHPVYIVDPPGTGRASRNKDLLITTIGKGKKAQDVILANLIGQSDSRQWAAWQNGPFFGELGFLGIDERGVDEAALDPTPHPSPMNQMPCDPELGSSPTGIVCANPDPEGVNQFIGHMNVVRTNVPGTNSITDPARDAAVIELLEHIGEPVIWMGWSRGGLFGQRLIVLRPDLFAAWAAFEGCQTSTEDQPVNGYPPEEFDDFLDEMTKPQDHLGGKTIPFLHVNPDYARDVGLSFGGTSRGVGQYLPSGKRCVLGDGTDPQNNVSKFINDNGGHAETIYAPDVGVFGNGHNPMFQDNIAEYAQIYLDWFKDNLN